MSGHTFFRHQGSFIVLSLLVVARMSFSSDVAASAAPPLPDGENRSLILGVVAKREQPAKAKAQEIARDSALAKIRSRLSGLQKIGLDFDLVQRPPEGPVRFVEQKEVKPGKDERRYFWFEAEAGFVLKDRKTGNRPDAALLDRADLLDIRIWSDKKEYWEGQTLTPSLQGNRDFHAKVVQIDPKGQILQILPNNYRQISVFEKDKPYRLPDEGDRYQLTVKPPFGTVSFIVYATRLPMSQVNLKTISGGIYEYRSSLRNFSRSVRRVIPIGEELLTEFCESVWNVKTLPRTKAP